MLTLYKNILMMKNISIIALSLALSFCSANKFKTGDAGSNTTPEQENLAGEIVESFSISSQETSNKSIDIFFLMDTSGSMKEEKTSLESSMSSFVNNYQRSNTNLDYKIFMVGSGFQFPNTAGNNEIKRIAKKVNSRDALEVFLNVISNPGRYDIRQNSYKSITIISDDNSRMSSSTFSGRLAAMQHQFKNGYEINGIVGLPSSQRTNTCEVEHIGSVYQELAQQSSGQLFDICDQNWSLKLENLSKGMIEKISETSYGLKQNVNLNKGLRVFYNGNMLNASDYNYNPVTRSVDLTNPERFQAGAKLEIRYFAN